MATYADILRQMAAQEPGAPLVDPETIRQPGPATKMRKDNELANAQHLIDLQSMPLPGKEPTYGQQVARDRAAQHVGEGMNVGGLTIYRGAANPQTGSMAKSLVDAYPEQGRSFTNSYGKAASDATKLGRTIYVGDKPIKLIDPMNHDYNPGWSMAEQALFDARGHLPRAFKSTQNEMRGVQQREGQVPDYLREQMDELKRMQGKIRVEDTGTVHQFELPDSHYNNMVDWDVPLHSQLPVVQRRFSGQPGNNIEDTAGKLMTDDMYRNYMGKDTGTGPYSLAPKMEKAGIPGFKYQATSDPNEQSMVVFPNAMHDLVPSQDISTQQIIDILRKNGGY